MAGPETSFGKRTRTDAFSRPFPAISETQPGDTVRKKKHSWPDDKKKSWSVVRTICGVGYVGVITVIAIGLIDRMNKTPEQLSEIARSDAARVVAQAAQARKTACAKDNSGMAFVMAQSEVTKRLASPSSATYPVLESRTQPIGDCLYRIKAVVDSQNGFGAMIRTPWSGTIEFHPLEGTWQVKSLSIGS
ncbi:hypothetical protein [Phyllobacterium zundukense]|uniref:Uncharacterized protein n=1 Tax=Phyllobacterium zundukense TaxID=1867719 RepID=A0ACD4CXA8_9HYPH|nr:hypothetical protein [Phyllobacterium zundukense]UXN58251.1 hypothetical protein N8E88_05415 [Phyllobacterium zundukense]